MEHKTHLDDSLFHNIVSQMPKFTYLGQRLKAEYAQCIYDEGLENEDILWRQYYRPYSVATGSSPSFVRQLLKKKEPMWMQMYFRSYFWRHEQLPDQYQNAMVRYLMELHSTRAKTTTEDYNPFDTAVVHGYAYYDTLSPNDLITF